MGDDLLLFLKGIALGLAIAAPVGPVGVLCIRRTLAEGRLIGFVSGLGAATADGLYGAVAAFGLTLIADLLTAQQFWLKLIGGLFLVYLGLRTLASKSVQADGQAKVRGLAAAYGSTLVLTLTNPMTILSFALIFGAAGVGLGTGRAFGAFLMVLGVLTGSALWWLGLSWAVGLLSGRLGAWLRWVNVVSGAVIMLFGVGALVGLWL